MARITAANEKKKDSEKSSVHIVGTELLVNNKPVHSFIHPPSPGEVCNAKRNFTKELDSFDLLKTKPITDNGSTFQGFAV